MTEAMVVSFFAGGAGLMSAVLLLRVLSQWHSPFGRTAITVDASVYLALMLTLVSGLLFGMITARQVWQSNPLQAMKSGPVAGTRVRPFTLRDFLLAIQIAVCTLLATASIVAVRSMIRMLNAPLGFQPHGAMLAELNLSEVTRDVPLERKSDARGPAEDPGCRRCSLGAKKISRARRQRSSCAGKFACCSRTRMRC